MNGPTRLTLLRIILIPLLVLVNYFDSPFNSWVALGIFLAASITDWLDGYLARKHNQITTLGKLLDPLADKLLVLTALLIILERKYIPAWLVILLIGREMGITGLRAFLAAEHIILPADKLGKWKMTFQVIAISFLFLSGEWHIFHWVGLGTAYLALIFSLVSAYVYIARFWALLGEKIMAEQLRKGNEGHDG